jgi:hypothetical protein
MDRDRVKYKVIEKREMDRDRVKYRVIEKDGEIRR